MREHGVSIDMTKYMNDVEIKKAIEYGAYSSVIKEKEFFRKYLTDLSLESVLHSTHFDTLKYI